MFVPVRCWMVEAVARELSWCCRCRLRRRTCSNQPRRIYLSQRLRSLLHSGSSPDAPSYRSPRHQPVQGLSQSELHRLHPREVFGCCECAEAHSSKTTATSEISFIINFTHHSAEVVSPLIRSNQFGGWRRFRNRYRRESTRGKESGRAS